MAEPSRRQLLLSLSAGGSALLAGCTTEQDDANETPTAAAGDNSSTESSQSVPEFPDDTVSDACPPFDDAVQVVCYETVDPEPLPLVLVPETQAVQLDQPTDFTLRNRSRQEFKTNFYHWELHKRVDGDWYHIEPQYWPQPLMSLEAGETHTWTLTVTTGRVSDGAAIDAVQGTESISVDGLGGGHYAFTTDGWFEAGSYEEPIALAASFKLEAGPLQLIPTTAIAETEWDGETLVARPTRGEADDDDERDAYILERTDDSKPDAEQVIIEQVVRDDQLRDAIALSREYEAVRVRLEEFSSSIPPFGIDDARTYEFQGDRYRVTTNAGESS